MLLSHCGDHGEGGRGVNLVNGAMARDDAPSEEAPANVSDEFPAKRPRRVTPSVITTDSDTTEREMRRNGNRHAGVADDEETRFLVTLRTFLETSAANPRAWEDPNAASTSASADTTASLGILSQHVSFTVPVFCRERVRLSALYREVAERGGYHAVTAHKQWRSVCVALGFDLEGQTSASYAMRRNYERTGLFLLEATGGDTTLDRAAAAAATDAAATAAAKAFAKRRVATARDSRRDARRDSKPKETRNLAKDEGLSSERAERPGFDAYLDAKRRVRSLRRELPAADVALAEAADVDRRFKKYAASAVTDEDEAELAKRLNLLSSLDPLSNPTEHAFLFPGINERDYLVVRNHVLRRWRDEPNTYVSVEYACSWFRPKFRALVHCAHRFLTTTGAINFGVGFASNYLDDVDRSGWGATRGTVVVVGAGLAGLQCARQLLSFGHKVVVVEARDRPGGRVYTKKLSGVDSASGKTYAAVAETGGSIVTGSDGNPLSVLARQLGARSRPIREACPMYLERTGGGVACARADAEVFEAYNGPGGALEGVNDLRQRMGAEANAVTLGEALERVRRETLRDKIDVSAGVENDLWHWHLANLEFANATRLDALSLGQWDQDDPYEFGGDHEWLPRGNSRVVAALARDVPIFYDVHVKTVETRPPHEDAETDASRVRVVASDGRAFVADAAVVTVPLGVLKRGDVTFSPPLPARKRRAIENLGFGVLNKVLLLFPFAFWDAEDADTFGYVNACDEGHGGGSRRGRYFMFYSYAGAELSGGATLVALVAGDAALSLETSETDEDCVAGVMRVLREIFAASRAVPDPVDVAVTRWGADPYARGSYSNISPRGTGDDYDALAEPVADALFFAGEATSRTHPATMHGAFLSGNREAARVHAALKRRGKRPRRGMRSPEGTGGAASWTRSAAVAAKPKQTETNAERAFEDASLRETVSDGKGLTRDASLAPVKVRSRVAVHGEWRGA